MIIGDDVLDRGLLALASADRLDLCETLPDSHAAVAAGSIGHAVVHVGAPEPRPGGGRQVPVAAITDGRLSRSRTARYFALTDAANHRLLIAAPLAGAVVVTSGNTFTLSQFALGFPSKSERRTGA